MFDVCVVRCESYEQRAVTDALRAALEPLGGLEWVKPGMRVGVKANHVEPLQIIAEILYRTSDGMGCIRTSGRELCNYCLLYTSNREPDNLIKSEVENMGYRFETLQLHVGQEQADVATDARAVPVSYTHLDVYKRQTEGCCRKNLWCSSVCERVWN